MDPVAVQILEEGWKKDGKVLSEVAAVIDQRLAERHAASAAAAAYELNRFYNVLVKSFERLCETFENHFEKGAAYHERLIERMELPVSGIRPCFLPPEALPAVRELKGLWHVMRHGYDLQLDLGRLASLAGHAGRVAEAFPHWCTAFLAEVRARNF